MSGNARNGPYLRRPILNLSLWYGIVDTATCNVSTWEPRWTRISRPNVSHFCGLKNSSIKVWGSQTSSIKALESYKHNARTIVFRLKPNLNCFSVKQACTKMWNIWSGWEAWLDPSQPKMSEAHFQVCGPQKTSLDGSTVLEMGGLLQMGL